MQQDIADWRDVSCRPGVEVPYCPTACTATPPGWAKGVPLEVCCVAALVPRLRHTIHAQHGLAGAGIVSIEAWHGACASAPTAPHSGRLDASLPPRVWSAFQSSLLQHSEPQTNQNFNYTSTMPLQHRAAAGQRARPGTGRRMQLHAALSATHSTLASLPLAAAPSAAQPNRPPRRRCCTAGQLRRCTAPWRGGRPAWRPSVP